MKSSPAPSDTARHPVLLSGVAAESLDGVAPKPLNFFVLGATGRTGLPFLSHLLARGHFGTIYVRNISKLPSNVAWHPHLRTFTGALHQADRITLALRAATPDVVYIMLTSEKAPHTAVSVGTHSVLLALEELRDLAAIGSDAMPVVSIAAGVLARQPPTSPAFLLAFSSMCRPRCSGRRSVPTSASNERRSRKDV